MFNLLTMLSHVCCLNSACCYETIANKHHMIGAFSLARTIPVVIERSHYAVTIYNKINSLQAI